MIHGCKYTAYSILIFIVFIITGCASVISKQVREQVNPDITVEEVFKYPERYKGEMIIVSGDIIETKNTKDGTLITAIQHPAGFRGRPKNVDESAGRFLAIDESYLDPYIYRKGRDITVAGEVQGIRTLPVGEIPYRYPVIHVKELYLWPVEKQPYSYPYRPYYYDDYWWWRRGFWYY